MFYFPYCLLILRKQVRRYVEDERLSHPRHFDTQALVTAVISLSSSGRDFDGGLYVSTGSGEGETFFVDLQAGDAVGLSLGIVLCLICSY